jgi:hypothetical protein
MTNETNWYSTTFKGWPTKQVGPKPTEAQLAAVHNLGARPGKQAMAIAMGLRDCGVTGSQIVVICGAPQLNKMRGFVDDRLLRKVAVPHDAKGHVVYKLEVTPKGQQRIDNALKRQAAQLAAEQATPDQPAKAKPAKKAAKAPAKAKGARKPRTATVAGLRAAQALSEAASATATVPTEVTTVTEGAPFEGTSLTTQADTPAPTVD